MRQAIRLFQDLCLLVTRVAFGLVLVMHGWTRWRTGIATQVDYLATHKVPYPGALAYGATALEVVGGLLLVLGLAVPLVALAVVVQNVLTIVWLRWNLGWRITDGGYEYNLVQAGLALLLVAFGAGRAGLDAALRNRRREDPERREIRENP